MKVSKHKYNQILAIRGTIFITVFILIGSLVAGINFVLASLFGSMATILFIGFLPEKEGDEDQDTTFY